MCPIVEDKQQVAALQHICTVKIMIVNEDILLELGGPILLFK